MGKSIKERLCKTIEYDKQEFDRELKIAKLKENEEIDIENFMNKKIKEVIKAIS